METLLSWTDECKLKVEYSEIYDHQIATEFLTNIICSSFVRLTLNYYPT